MHDERAGDARLAVCGDGPLKQLYRQQVAERTGADIHWAGGSLVAAEHYRSAHVL